MLEGVARTGPGTAGQGGRGQNRAGEWAGRAGGRGQNRAGQGGAGRAWSEQGRKWAGRAGERGQNRQGGEDLEWVRDWPSTPVLVGGQLAGRSSCPRGQQTGEREPPQGPWAWSILVGTLARLFLRASVDKAEGVSRGRAWQTCI